MLNKERLIDDLKKIHKEVVNVYRNIFDYKYENDSKFRSLIEEEYKRENITSKNDKESWNEKYLHRSAYTLLNKILFIRICEDKGFMLNDEDKVMGEEVNPNIGKKLSMIGLHKWKNLISNYSLSELIKFAFKDMNESYKNISLYKEDKYDWLIPNKNEVELRFQDENLYAKTPYSTFEALLGKIIETLDTSRYNFGGSNDNILGDVYEKFMDRETRKVLGQFYTPDFIIEYILNNTVVNIDVIENPFVRILDPSCGSGHFLIMAYDILREKFEKNLGALREKYKKDYYEVKYRGDIKVISGEEYWTKKYLHYHILKHCIFGADIDAFALQITTINLLLKDLDNFITDELNIIECDSLIKWEEDYDWQKLVEQLNNGELFLELKYNDFYGNKKVLTPSFEEAYRLVKVCEFWSKKFDYVVGNPPYLLCQEDNVPRDKVFYYRNRYESAQYKTDLYHLFLERGLLSTKENGIMSFITPNTYLTNVFNDKLRSFFLKHDIEEIRIIPKEVFKDAYVDVCIIRIRKSDFKDEILIKEDDKDGVKKFYASQSKFLKNHKYIFNLSLGSKKEFGDYKELGELFHVYFGAQTYDKSRFVSNVKYNEEWIPCINGKDIQKYFIDQKEKTYLHHKPENIKSGGNDSYQLTEKIVVRQIGGPEPICSYDSGEYYSLNTVYNLVPKNSAVDLKYILGILNSNYMKEYWMQNFSDNKKLFPKIKKHQLESLPIKFSNPEIMNKISFLVEKIINNNKEIKKIREERRFLSARGIEEIKKEYVSEQTTIELLNAEIEDYKFEINELVKQIYETKSDKLTLLNSQEEYEIIFSDPNFVKNFENIKKYCNENQLSLKGAIFYRNKYLRQEELSKIEGFFDELYKDLKQWLLNECLNLFVKGNSFYSIKLINDEISKNSKFGDFITILKKDNITKKSEDVIKDVLNEFSDTFKTYKKNKDENKSVKQLVKYDTSIYGLSEWSDKKHSEYFIETIKYHTSMGEDHKFPIFHGTKKNKNKANEALQILKQLDFDDKEDYIEILTEKIRKAFE